MTNTLKYFLLTIEFLESYYTSRSFISDMLLILLVFKEKKTHTSDFNSLKNVVKFNEHES